MPVKSKLAYAANQSIHWKTVDHEAVLFNHASGGYYSLDPVATFLWEKIAAEPCQIKDLLNELISEYNCQEQEAKRDIQLFLAELKQENLVEEVHGER